MATNIQAITDNLDLWTSALLTRSTAGRGSGGRVEAYGIKKLRELILELAVRGKLVGQEPDDEPAAKLLERIRAEKTRLVKEQKIRKADLMQSVSDEEAPYELQQGWEWTYLSQVSNQVHYGYTASADHSSTNVRMLRITDIQNNRVDWDAVPGCQIEPDAITAYELHNGDLLIARTGGTIGKSYLVENLNLCAVFASYLIRVIPNCHSLPNYIKLYADSPIYWKQLYEKSMGTGQPNVNGVSLSSLLLPLPPLAEQHRIVAKVDELMALCDQLEQHQTTASEAHQTLVETLLGTLTNTPVRPEPVEGHASSQPFTLRQAQGERLEGNSSGRTEFDESWTRIANHFDTLFTTEQSIDQLKQTILQLAVMGKLVPQDPNDEPTSEFLKRKELMADENIPFRIPDSWVWARVDEFAQTRLGKMLDKAKNKGTPVRYLRNINVRWFDFDLSDVKEMRFEDSEIKEFALRDGDVLICEGGYPGRAAVWDEREANIYFQKAIHRVRFMNGFNPNYFVNVLRESADSGRLSSYFTGAGIQHFTGKGLMSFLVPIPPLSEQHRIVTKVNELMTLCDTLKARLAAAQTTQLHLADTIVEQTVA